MKPLTLLLSSHAAEAFGPRIAAALEGAPLRIVDPDEPPGPDGSYDIDIAFLTREVTGRSGKTELTPALQRFGAVLRASPGLRWLQAHSAGVDRPIFGELHRRGVTVTTASGTSAGSVAQMAITGLLALARGLPALMDAQRRHAWEPLHPPHSPRDLAELTVVIVGLGPIGREVARLCAALGVKAVIGINRSGGEARAPFARVLAVERLDEVLPQADFLVLACPLTDATRGLVDARRLGLLPRGARLINVARGEVVEEPALALALADGQLGGAFLDVFVREPLDPRSPFWKLPNVIVSPHSAAHTTGQFEAVGQLFLENLARWRRGEALRNVATFAPA